MTTPRLSAIQITNFRSIRGTVSIPLDAPVVLLHGTNGAGKSTVMSALELGLTGRVSDVTESDRNHLVHQGEPGATIELVSSGGAHTLHLVGGRLSGNSLLGPDDSRFFGERCYLQQRTLTRLLEMYERESGKGESRLTRFVNDLLGLGELEALLSGMHPVTHRARLKRLVPELTVLETERDTFKAELQQLREREQELAISRSAPATQLREILRALGAPGDIEDIEDFLSQTSRQDELIDLAAQRREVIAMQRHAEAIGGAPAGKELTARSIAAQKAREVAAEWRHTHGRALEAVLEGLRLRFPGLPDAETAQDPAAVRVAVLGEVEAALKRLRDTLAVDASARADLAQLDAVAAEAQMRLAAIEAQLAASNPAAETEQLATALAALIPHIHGDDCPVCGRAFQEVSAEPLVAHLSMRVSELSERAQRVGLLAKAHLEAANDARRLSDQRGALQARMLAQDVRLGTEAELVFFEEAHARLVSLQEGVAAGAEIMRSLSTAERALVQAEEKARGYAVLVSSVREFAATSSRVRVDAERIEETLRAIADELADRITAAE